MRAIHCKCINFHRREMQCNKVDEKQNQKSNFLLIANHKPLISKGGMERAQNSSKVWKNHQKVFDSLGRLAIKACTSNKNQRAFFCYRRNIKS